MSIDNTVTLRRSTDVGMRWHNVIGQKEIELYPGTSGPILGPGSTIPLTHDVTDASIDAFLNSLGPVLSSINPTEANEFVENVSGALEGDTAQINQLINSGAAVSSTVQALDTQVGQIIGNLDQVLTALASRSGDIDSLVTNLQTVSSALASKNTLLDDVVGNLSQVADRPGRPDREQPQHHHQHHRQPAGGGGRRAEQPAEPGQQPVQPRRGAGPLHPDLPVGAVVRRRDHLHLSGRPDRLPLLPARATRRRARVPSGARRCRPRSPASPRRACPTPTASSSSPRAGRQRTASRRGRLAGGVESGARPPGGQRGRAPREAPSEGLHRAEPQGARHHGGRGDGRLHPGHPLPQPQPVHLRLHHRRPLHQRGRHLQGHRGHGGRRQRRVGPSVEVHGNAVDAQLSVEQLGASCRTTPRRPSRSRRCSASST